MNSEMLLLSHKHKTQFQCLIWTSQRGAERCTEVFVALCFFPHYFLRPLCSPRKEELPTHWFVNLNSMTWGHDLQPKSRALPEAAKPRTFGTMRSNQGVSSELFKGRWDISMGRVSIRLGKKTKIKQVWFKWRGLDCGSLVLGAIGNLFKGAPNSWCD